MYHCGGPCFRWTALMFGQGDDNAAKTGLGFLVVRVLPLVATDRTGICCTGTELGTGYDAMARHEDSLLGPQCIVIFKLPDGSLKRHEEVCGGDTPTHFLFASNDPDRRSLTSSEGGSLSG